MSVIIVEDIYRDNGHSVVAIRNRIFRRKEKKKLESKPLLDVVWSEEEDEEKSTAGIRVTDVSSFEDSCYSITEPMTLMTDEDRHNNSWGMILLEFSFILQTQLVQWWRYFTKLSSAHLHHRLQRCFMFLRIEELSMVH